MKQPVIANNWLSERHTLMHRYANIRVTFMYDDKKYAKGKGRATHISTTTAAAGV